MSRGQATVVPLVLVLPYARPGTDWHEALEECQGDAVQALRRWSARLERAADGLGALADVVEDGRKARRAAMGSADCPLEDGQGCSHLAMLEVHPSLVDRAVATGVAERVR